MTRRFEHDDVRMLDEIVGEAIHSFPLPSSRSAPDPVRMLDEIVSEHATPSVWLEIRLRPDGRHDTKTYSDDALDKVSRILTVDPPLGLTFDSTRSRLAGEEVVLVFNPGPVENPAARLVQILDRVMELLRPKNGRGLVLMAQTADVRSRIDSPMAA
jgi:hypothetical protein